MTRNDLDSSRNRADSARAGRSRAGGRHASRASKSSSAEAPDPRMEVMKPVVKRGHPHAGGTPTDKAAVAPEPSPPKPKRMFGLFKGKFSVGPEFYEPLSQEELETWGER